MLVQLNPTNATRTVAVTLNSAGFFTGSKAEIWVDGRLVPMPFGYFRGYNVAAINPVTGDVTTSKFDVLGSIALLDAFADFVDSLPEGTIVLIAVADEATLNMNERFLTTCEALGSTQIRALEFRGAWVFATKKGHPDQLLVERMSNTEAISIETRVELPQTTGTLAFAIESSGWYYDHGVEMSIDDDVVLANSTAAPGLHFVSVDPEKRQVVDATVFNIGTQQKQMIDHVGDLPAGQMVLVGVKHAQEFQLLTDAGHDAIRSLGGVQTRTLQLGHAYALIGWKGAIPGSVPERATMNSIRLGAHIGPDGSWAPFPSALVFPRRHYSGDPLMLQRTTSGLTGFADPDAAPDEERGSIMPGPGVGVTIRRASRPGADHPQPDIVSWGPTSYVGPEPIESVTLWPVADQVVRRRLALRLPDGRYMTVPDVTAGSLASPATGQALKPKDFVEITLGTATGGGRSCAIRAFIPTANGDVAPAALFATTDNGAVEFGLERADRPPPPLVHNEEGYNAFSIELDGATPRWLDTDFRFTTARDDRAVFQTPFRYAEAPEPGVPADVGATVGPLVPGEVALHAEPGFGGAAIVLTEDVSDVNMLFPLFDFESRFPGPSSPESIRLGPHTAIKAFASGGWRNPDDSFVLPGQDGDRLDWWDLAVSGIRIDRLAKPGGQPMTVAVELGEDHRLDEAGELQQFDAYRTTLNLPPNVQIVEVRAGTPVTVGIGAEEYAIGPDSPAVVAANAAKTLVVTTEAADLGTAALRFRTDTMHPGESFPVFPDRVAHERLAVHTEPAPDVAARMGLTPDGQQALGHVMSTITYGAHETVIGEAHTRRISSHAMPDPGWKLDGLDPSRGRDAANFNHITSEQVDAETSNATDGDALDSGQGRGRSNPLWDEIVSGAHAVETIIVHKVEHEVHAVAHDLHVVFKYGGEAVSFALHTAERAMQLARVILSRLAADVRTVIAAIKAVFDWDAILTTQRVIVRTFNDALDRANASLHTTQPSVDRWFTDVKSDVLSAIDTKIAEHRSDREDAVTSVLAPHPSSDHDVAHRNAHEKMHWLLAKFVDHPPTATTGVAKETGEPSSFTALVESIATKIADDQDIGRAIARSGVFVKDAFGDPAHAPEFVMDALLESVKALLAVGFDVLDEITDALIAALEAVVDAFRDLLDQPIQVPLLTSLFQWAVARHPAPGSTTSDPPQLTMLDLVGLLAAIPTTILVKAVTGHAPFPAQDERDVTTPGSTDPAKLAWGFIAGLLSLISTGFKTVLDVQVVRVPTPGQTSWLGAGEGMLRPLDLRTRANLQNRMEWMSLAIDAGVQVATWPEGVPLRVLNPFPTHDLLDDKAEWWDRFLWTYEFLPLAVDGVMLALSGSRTGRQAAGTLGPATATILGFARMGIIITTLVQEGLNKGPEYKEHVLPVKAMQEYLGALPDMLAWLRAPNLVLDSLGTSLFALAACDVLFGGSGAAVYMVMAEKGLIDPTDMD